MRPGSQIYNSQNILIRVAAGITEKQARRGGVIPVTFALKRDRWLNLHAYLLDMLNDEPFPVPKGMEREYRFPLSAPIGRPNLMVVGVPVVIL